MKRDERSWSRRLLYSDPCPGPGDAVELRRWGTVIRRGVVEAVMPDSSGFWLTADGVEHREFVHRQDDETQIWI